MIQAGTRSTYVQINIYNRSLVSFEQDGINLNEILKDIGCNSFWIGESVVCGVNELMPDSSSGSHVNVETTEMIDGTGPLSTTVADVKFPRCSTPIVSKRWPSFNMLPSGISNIFRVPSNGESEQFTGTESAKSGETEENIHAVLENIIQNIDIQYQSTVDASRSKQIPALKSSRTPFPGEPAGDLLDFFQTIASFPMEESSSSRGVQETPEGRTVVKRESTEVLAATSNEPVYQQLYNHPVSTTALSNHQLQFSISGREEEEEMDNEEGCDDGLDYGADDTRMIITKPIGDSLGIPETNPEQDPELDPKVNQEVSRINDGIQKNWIAVPCEFPSCGRHLRWRKKFGKQRLLDHALTHVDEPLIKCRYCETSVKTVRNMKVHYRNSHENIKMSGYGVKNLDVPDHTIQSLWEICFSQKIGEVGLPSKRKKPKVVVKRKAGRPKKIRIIS